MVKSLDLRGFRFAVTDRDQVHVRDGETEHTMEGHIPMVEMSFIVKFIIEKSAVEGVRVCVGCVFSFAHLQFHD